MARLVKIEKNQKVFAKLVIYLNDGTTIEHPLSKGDTVEDLRYVTRNGDIKTISGRVSSLNISMSGKKQKIDKKDPQDTFNDDVDLLTITIDASKKYESNIVVINAKEIIEYEDEKDLDIKEVHPYLWTELDMDMYYSNMTTEHQSLAVGDLFEDMVIMNGIPKTPDITGTFKLRCFSYTNSRNMPDITGLVLENVDTKEIINAPLKNVLSFHEIQQLFPSTTEELLDALTNAEPGAIITPVSDIPIEQVITLAADTDLTLNLEYYSITVPEPVNNRSIYAIDNGGNLTLDGGSISARGIEVLEGGITIINGTHITSRDSNGGAGVWVYDGGSLVINDGVFDTLHVGSTSESSGPGCLNNGGNCIIYGGTFTSPNKRTYCIISRGGHLVVAEGADVNVTGAHGGICIDGGTAEIHSGKFTSTEYYGLYVSNDALKAGVTVYGGEFTGPNYSVWVGSDINDPVDSTVDIYGGIFNGPLKDQKNVAENAGITVYGGKFSTIVEDKFLADGYVCSTEPDEDGYYTVYEATEVEDESTDSTGEEG